MDDTAFYVFIGLALGEAFSSGLWQRWYFRSGFVVFSRRVQASRPGSPLPAPDFLEAALKSSWLPSLLFRESSPCVIPFREKVLEFRRRLDSRERGFSRSDRPRTPHCVSTTRSRWRQGNIFRIVNS